MQFQTDNTFPNESIVENYSQFTTILILFWKNTCYSYTTSMISIKATMLDG